MAAPALPLPHNHSEKSDSALTDEIKPNYAVSAKIFCFYEVPKTGQG